jgi:hypothetical protein
MNILDILIILIIGFVLYKFTIEKSEKKNNKNYDNINDEIIIHNESAIIEDDLIVEEDKSTTIIHPYFNDCQFHTDYRDTVNIFNKLVSSQHKQLFNIADIPTVTSKPSKKEINVFIKSFIKEVNKHVKNINSTNEIMNWNDNLPDKKVKAGWDKQLEKLGLPGSLYVEPAEKAKIKLLKIDKTEKIETNDEVRYSAFIIIQKENVSDQLIVKVSFYVNKNDCNLDREFFNKDKKNIETCVQIEEVFVVGFMTNNSFGKKSEREKNYNFDKITDGRMFSQKEIIKQLNNKKIQLKKESV